VVDLTFSPPERRSLLLPATLALSVIAAAALLILRYTPHTTATLAITHTNTYQAHTVFKSDTILVGKDKAQDDFYVLTTLRIQDNLRLPLFLKDLTATLTTVNGEVLETSAIEKPDITPLLTTFPALRPLASPPLLRETTIQPGQSAEGMVILHFPTTQDTWNRRQAATLTVAFYHQPPQTITIPTP